jgi:hypothetical protein
MRVKVDVSGVDPADAKREPPKPGVYRAVVDSLVSRKPEGKQQRLEVVMKITGGGDKKYHGAKIYDYINLENENVAWKLDQFLQAFGVTSTKKRKATFDTDDLVGESCKIRVRGGTNQNDEYRAEMAAYLEADEEDDDEEGEEEDGEEEAGEESDDEDEGEGEEEEGEEAEDDGYDELSTADIKAELKERGLKTLGVRSALLERLRENDAESEEEEEPDVDYDAMSIADLKAECKARELPVTGTRSAIIKRLRKADEEPLDE